MQAQSHLQFLPHPETETLHHQGAHCIWWGDRHPGWAYLGQWFRGGGGLSAGGPPALGHPPTPPGTAAPGRLGPVGGAAGGGLRIRPPPSSHLSRCEAALMLSLPLLSLFLVPTERCHHSLPPKARLHPCHFCRWSGKSRPARGLHCQPQPFTAAPAAAR